jgi:hypothetical protein
MTNRSSFSTKNIAGKPALIHADLHPIAANQHYLQLTRVFSTDSARRIHPVL